MLSIITHARPGSKGKARFCASWTEGRYSPLRARRRAQLFLKADEPEGDVLSRFVSGAVLFQITAQRRNAHLAAVADELRRRGVRGRSEREPREPRERRPVVPEEDALVYEVSETGEAKGNIPDFGFDDEEE